MNILMIKLSAIGDVVHTLPALAGLRERYPQAHITWVIEEAAADLIAGHPQIDQVVIFRRKRWMKELRAGRVHRVCRETKAFLQALRQRPYDLVIDFHGLFKSAMLAGLSGGRRKLGYDSLQELSGLFYNEKISEDMGKHAVDRYLDFLSYLGSHSGRPAFLIPTTQENADQVSALLREHGATPEAGAFIAMNPVALWQTKLWSQGKFAVLSQKIREAWQLPVVLTGSAAEKPYLDEIQAMATAPVINLAGRTSLRDLAHLYRLAALVITTDSGPMHIAAAVGTPVIALFGPTDPSRTGPYGEGHVVIRPPLPCSPCFRKQCDTQQCMEAIRVDDVFEAVGKKLEEKRKTNGKEKEKNGYK